MESPVRDGELLADKYRVERVLGVGGMGVVVAARHVELDERVALKFLHPAAAEKEELVERFMREARAAARIKSEHVVRVLDVGRFDNGLPYIVMEYLDGRDLAASLALHGPMPVPEAVESILQACEALSIAHALGIVHRDIKPANLFQTHRPDGTPLFKLLDFGVSKTALTGRVDDMDISLTRSQSVIGSPFYMSPEAMRSARLIETRSDIWSLGVVLYELVSGLFAFPGDSITQVCIAVTNGQPRPLRSIRPEISPEFERIVLRCLEKSPEDRYSTVADLAEDLLPFAPERAKVLVERARAVLDSPRPAMTSSLPDWPPVSSKVDLVTSRVKSPVVATWDALTAQGFVTPEVTLRSGAIPQQGGSYSGSAVASSASLAEPAMRPTAATSWRERVRWPAITGVAGLATATAVLFGARVVWQGPELALSAPSVVSSQSTPHWEAATFTLRLESQPSGATVFEGDAALGDTPLQLTISNATVVRAPKRLSIRKEGYDPRTIEQGPSTVDVQQVLALVASRDAQVERPKLPALRRPTKAKSAPTEPAPPAPEIRVIR